jgi:hypothetical protein
MKSESDPEREDRNVDRNEELKDGAGRLKEGTG